MAKQKIIINMWFTITNFEWHIILISVLAACLLLLATLIEERGIDIAFFTHKTVYN